jgi:hypothetical protein
VIQSRRTIVATLKASAFTDKLLSVSQSNMRKVVNIGHVSYMWYGANIDEKSGECICIFVERKKGDPIVIGAPNERFAGCVWDMDIVRVAAMAHEKELPATKLDFADEVLFLEMEAACS